MSFISVTCRNMSVLPVAVPLKEVSLPHQPLTVDIQKGVGARDSLSHSKVLIACVTKLVNVIACCEFKSGMQQAFMPGGQFSKLLPPVLGI